MIITGKIVDEIEIKAGGDVFHEYFAKRPHKVSSMCPNKIHGCDLHLGDWGKVGCIIRWGFTLDGKKQSAAKVVEVVDDENKIVKQRFIEGELMEHYKTIVVTIHVQTHGNNHLVTWTMEYEKMNENVPDLVSLMKLAIEVTKDIEAYHHGQK